MFRLMLFEAEAQQKTSGMFIYYFSRTIGIFLVVLVCFFNEHKEKARAPRTKLGT